MRKLFLTLLVLAAASGIALAQQQVKRVGDLVFDDVTLKRTGDRMNVSIKMDLTRLNVRTRRSVHIIPVLINGQDSLELSPIGIYSNGRYVSYLRNGQSVFEDLGEKVYREEEVPAIFDYQTAVPYADWMDGSYIYVSRKTYGCCMRMKDQQRGVLADYSVPKFEPLLIYMDVPERVTVSVTKELYGAAYINYGLSRTDVLPDYRQNRGELAKILSTIDSVKNVNGVTVKKIYLRGYASPESPLDNNERLARERTLALKDYIMGQYSFEEGIIETSYDPESWDGLRTFVEASYLPHKRQILAVIDGSRDPDTKEWIIKSKYPDDYKFMVKTYYPLLRKTDYRIVYVVDEDTMDANTYEPACNLNAANDALAEGRYRDARRHLLLAGDTEEAIYTWGVYYLGVGDYVRARSYLKEARALGIMEASAMLRQCDALEEFYDGK